MEFVAYGLDTQSQCICPLNANDGSKEELHRFLVGTATAVMENKIYVLEFNDTLRTIECAAVWPHDDKVISISCPPAALDYHLFATTTPRHIHFWHTVSAQPVTCPSQKTDVALDNVHHVLWDTTRASTRDCIACQPDRLTAFALDDGGEAKERVSVPLDRATLGECTAACLDTQHPSSCLAAMSRGGVCHIDLRSANCAQVMPLMHSEALHGFGAVLTIDTAASPSQRLLTGGDDGVVQLFDMQRRSAGGGAGLVSKRCFTAHEHAVNRTSFNPFHDELILSCGSDQAMRLWDTSGSAPLCLKTIAEFGDSVIDACWGSNGPWTFAGLSFNGKVIIDTVPSEKRMSILLDEGH